MRTSIGTFITVLLIYSARPGAILAQTTTDTVTLTVGHPNVDGTLYKPHWAAAERSVMKDDHIVRALAYRSHTYIAQRGGVPVCIVESLPYPDAADQQFYELTVLDRRTTALLHIEQRDGTGRMLVADVNGTHVTGRTRASREAPEEPLDFALDTPSYYSPFVDAAIGATEIRAGQVWRVPTFTFGSKGRKTEWQTFHVSRQERVPAGSEAVDAWVIEDGAANPTTIWITMQPPYLPQVLHYLPDGSISRFASRLLRSDLQPVRSMTY